MTTSNISNGRTLISIMLFLGVASFAALGHAEAPATKFVVKEALAASDLVFHGVVTRVDYRASNEGTPHAFVTYEIKAVIRGSIESAGKTQTIILRFIGGPRGNGSFLIVSVVPNFAEGDQDILFVRGNGSRGCPLVSCSYGRFRILDGSVYQAFGTPVVGVRDGRIKAFGPKRAELLDYRFPAPSFDALYARPEVKEAYEALTKTADVDSLRKAYEAHAPKQIVMKPIDTETGDGDYNDQTRVEPVSLEAFLHILVTASREVPGRPPQFKSVDPDTPFNYELPKPAVPPAAKPRKTQQLLPIDINGKELQKYRDEQYNPVDK